MRSAVSEMGLHKLGVICGDLKSCLSSTKKITSRCLAIIRETNPYFSHFLTPPGGGFHFDRPAPTYKVRPVPLPFAGNWGGQNPAVPRAARCPDSRVFLPLLRGNQLYVLLPLRSALTPTEIWGRKGFL